MCVASAPPAHTEAAEVSERTSEAGLSATEGLASTVQQHEARRLMRLASLGRHFTTLLHKRRYKSFTEGWVALMMVLQGWDGQH